MAGLKFYLCQTSDGPQYVHLQADAKKLDPTYETVEIDTSKQALMDRLNHLLRSPVSGLSLVDDDEDLEEPDGPVAAPAPRSTGRKPDVAKRVERTYDQIEFEHFIWSIPDDEAYRLNLLEKIIKERRAEIAGEAKAPAPPPPPLRNEWKKK